MAEYINKTDLLERLQNVLQSEYPENKIKALYAHSVVSHAPAADVVEVVRCKHCRMYVDDKEAFVKYCKRGLRNINVQPDGFCSYGERKENG